TDLQCYGESSGEIDITPFGGTAPYTYLWNNSTTDEDLAGLTAGLYTIVLSDNNGCLATEVISIAEPSAISVTGAPSAVSCFGGNNGAIDLSVTGGTPDINGPADYYFEWSNGSTTEDISGLAAGTYTVTVTDFNNCASTAFL